MRTRFTLLAVLITAFFCVKAQQFPNASFDFWSNPLTPNGWATNSSAFGFPLGLEKRDTVNIVPEFGPASIQLKSDTIPGFPQYGVYPGHVSIGTGVASQGPPRFTGVPFPFRPDTLVIIYKYAAAGSDKAAVKLTLRDNNTSLVSQVLPLEPTAGQWALVKIAMDAVYGSPTVVPDSILLEFSSSQGGFNVPLPSGIQGSVLNLEAAGFIYVPATAVLTTTDPTVFCEGDSANLTAAITNGNPTVTYQWMKDGSPVANATSANYTATTTGAYALEVTNGDVSDTSAAITVTVQVCTGIEAVNAATVSVYPNPVANILNVTATESLAGFELNMLDAAGRTVLTTNLNGNANAINVAELAKGTYVYTIGNKANGVVKTNTIQIAK